MIVNTNPSKQRSSTHAELVDDVVKSGDFFGTTIGDKGYVWQLTESEAVRYGVPNPDHRSKVVVPTGGSLRNSLATLQMFDGKEFVIHKLNLQPGQFYPRIARPNDQHPLQSPGHLPGDWKLETVIFGVLGQLRSLVSMLDQIVQTVHPTDANLSCFGTTIRNLIILAATECEAQWKGILRANGITKNQLTTYDYVKLKTAMRLDEYEVKLRHFPWLAGWSPYSGWCAQFPTKSLKWYDSYNSIKHDREANFQDATLECALKAISALWVLVAAQFGHNALREFDDLRGYFHLERVPLWKYSEVYCHTYETDNHKPISVAYSF